MKVFNPPPPIQNRVARVQDSIEIKPCSFRLSWELIYHQDGIIILMSSEKLSRQMYKGSFLGVGQIQCGEPNRGCCFHSFSTSCQILSVLKKITNSLIIHIEL